MKYDCIIVLALAFVADRLLGDPRYRFHPVRLIGALIGKLEHLVRRLELNSRAGGLALLLANLYAVVGVYALLRVAATAIHSTAAIALDAFVLYSCIALRDMEHHAVPIANTLGDGDTEGARERVKGIVGRDVSKLDHTGIARAVVESVSEGFLDGFLAPLFWFLVGAIVGVMVTLPPLAIATSFALAYRTVNTLDSMVGYRNERHGRIGWASAHTDDALNFLPARLTILVMAPAARIIGLDAKAGWRIGWRDRLKHASPNSAHPESFAAGALGVRLGGPTQYPHGLVDKPWIGSGTDEITHEHIRQTCRLTAASGWIATAVAAIVLLAVM